MKNKFTNFPVLIKTLPFVISVIFLKMFVCDLFLFNGVHINSLIEFSDIGIIFTGAFFVVGLMLASTMTDFKESE